MITMSNDGAKGSSPKVQFGDDPTIGARIKVIGVGGGGGNAVNRMIAANLHGVDFVATNTDCQALKSCLAPLKIQIGNKLTKGLGAGANPEVGRQAALEDTEKLIETLEGADMVFIAAGLGGGTGTGATPVIASLASEMGALVVAVVTKPFQFEGKRRRAQAERGLQELREAVDTVIAIPNEKLLQTVERTTTLTDAFLIADDILRQAVQGISDLITVPGEINLDFADVRTIMSGMGMALMGTGVGRGENRAQDAAQRAISSPLLEDTSINGAQGVLINITGGPSMTLHEVSDASTVVHDAAHPEANIIFGTVIDKAFDDCIKVTVIATGFQREIDQIFEGGVRGVAKRPRSARPPGLIPPGTLATEAGKGQPALHAPGSESAKHQAGLSRRAEEAPAEPAPAAPERVSSGRGRSSGPFSFFSRRGDASNRAYYASQHDDLDVPTFLRKQQAE
jgi:cell division protein FtsZ